MCCRQALACQEHAPDGAGTRSGELQTCSGRPEHAEACAQTSGSVLTDEQSTWLAQLENVHVGWLRARNRLDAWARAGDALLDLLTDGEHRSRWFQQELWPVTEHQGFECEIHHHAEMKLVVEQVTARLGRGNLCRAEVHQCHREAPYVYRQPNVCNSRGGGAPNRKANHRTPCTGAA